MQPRPLFNLKVNRRKILLGQRTVVMGVLNITPDSFSDGGQFLDPQRASDHAIEMIRQGADWIDIGGESTRPGAKPVSAEEELRRVLPAIRALRKKIPSVPISIDTTKAMVADEAARAGASILNDVSGLRFDSRLAEVALRFRLPLILTHLRGRPETMQKRPFARSVWQSVRSGLASSIRRALASGLQRSQLIIDPGVGFGKSGKQNFELLAHLERLHKFQLPILVGTSRKSFVQAAIRSGAADETGAIARMQKGGDDYWPLMSKGKFTPLQIGDSAAVVASILSGAHIVRVHDVATAIPAVRIADAVLASSGPQLEF